MAINRDLSANYKQRYDGWELGSLHGEDLKSVCKIEVEDERIEVNEYENSRKYRIPLIPSKKSLKTHLI